MKKKTLDGPLHNLNFLCTHVDQKSKMATSTMTNLRQEQHDGKNILKLFISETTEPFEPKLVGMCLELSFGIPTWLPQQDIGPMGKMKTYFFSDTRYQIEMKWDLNIVVGSSFPFFFVDQKFQLPKLISQDYE